MITANFAIIFIDIMLNHPVSTLLPVIARLCSTVNQTVLYTNNHMSLSCVHDDTQEQFLLFSTIFCILNLDFSVKTRTRFSLRDNRLFEITEVDCIHNLLMKISVHAIRSKNTQYWNKY